MVTPDFSAPSSALGYLYQVRAALMLALEGSEQQGVVVEGLDDISIHEEDRAAVLLQLKHHSVTASLTDSSSDLWKTIRIWSTYLKDGRLSLPNTTLVLLTTATAPAQSIASHLKHGATRNPDAALSSLDRIATDSQNQALAQAFAAFRDLSAGQKQTLVDGVYVMDGSPDVVGVQERIQEVLKLAARPEHRDGLLERLEGWWFGRIVRALKEHDVTPIRGGEVFGKLYSIAEQFRPDALPIDFLEALPPTHPDPQSDSRRFVLQLREIAAGSSRIERAILDYYRAFEQRSRWAREELVVPFELERYEAKLVDEWRRYSDALADQTPPLHLDEEGQRSFGKKVFSWMDLEADFRIRESVTEAYVMRGSFHMLADQEPLRVWWHPMFAQRLARLLATGLPGAP